MYESAQFHQQVQQPDQTVESYYVELCKTSKRCNYSSAQVEERLVCDHFIVGLQDAALTSKLCRNPQLTLKEVWIQARQVEDAEKQRSKLGAQAAVQGALNLNAAKHRGSQPRRERRAELMPARQNAASQNLRFLWLRSTCALQVPSAQLTVQLVQEKRPCQCKKEGRAMKKRQASVRSPAGCSLEHGQRQVR